MVRSLPLLAWNIFGDATLRRPSTRNVADLSNSTNKWPAGYRLFFRANGLAWTGRERMRPHRPGFHGHFWMVECHFLQSKSKPGAIRSWTRWRGIRKRSQQYVSPLYLLRSRHSRSERHICRQSECCESTRYRSPRNLSHNAGYRRQWIFIWHL